MKKSATVLGALVFAIALNSCAGESRDDCEPSLLGPDASIVEPGDEDQDWRAKLEDVVETSAPDRVLRVTVWYTSQPTPEDLEHVRELGGVVAYEFLLLPGRRVEMEVAGLAVLAESDRIVKIKIPGPQRVTLDTC